MGEDRDKIQVDEDEAVRSAVGGGDDVEGHRLERERVERDAVASGDDDVEAHALREDAVRGDALRD